VVQGDRAARVLNVITAAGLVVPALAPLLGSAILAFADWRAIFLVLAALGAAVGVWSALRIPETHRGDIQTATTTEPTQETQQPSPTPATRTSSVLRFAMYTAIVGLGFMAMYAYVSSAPFVFQQLHGFTPTGYAWTGALLSLTMAAVGMLGSRVIGRPGRFGTLTASRAVAFGLGLLVVGSLLVLTTVYLNAHVAWYIAALMIAVAPVALISGSATALAMDASPLRSGTSSAIIGFSQSMLGALPRPLVGILGVDARPMALVFVTASILALVAAGIATLAARKH